MMERVALSAGRCGPECVEYSAFIECTYLDVSMKIYYDDKAIVSVDIDEQ